MFSWKSQSTDGPASASAEPATGAQGEAGVREKLLGALARGALRIGRLGRLGKPWFAVYQYQVRRMGARCFRVRSFDGTPLEAMYVPGRTGVRRGLPILAAHGYCQTKEFHLPRLLPLAEAGHDLVLFDHRAHGRSGGGEITFGVCECRDMQAVLDTAEAAGFLRGTAAGSGGVRVINYGYSLGAAAALMHAARDERVAGVVALAPFLNLRQALGSYHRLLVPFLRLEKLIQAFEKVCLEAGFHIDQASPLEAIRQIRVPVLLIMGAADRNLSPVEHGRVLAAAKIHGACRVLEVKGAGHVSLIRWRRAEVEEAMIHFCRSLSEGV